VRYKKRGRGKEERWRVKEGEVGCNEGDMKRKR